MTAAGAGVAAVAMSETEGRFGERRQMAEESRGIDNGTGRSRSIIVTSNMSTCLKVRHDMNDLLAIKGPWLCKEASEYVSLDPILSLH